MFFINILIKGLTMDLPPLSLTSNSRPPFILRNSKLFEDHFLKGDIILEIFKWINTPKVIKNCALTCQGWNSVIPDSFHLRFKMCLGNFSFPLCTLFKATYWPALCLPISIEHADKGDLFYSGHETVTFPLYKQNPLGCVEPSNPNLICTKEGSFIDNYAVFGSHNGKYVLQPLGNPDKLIIANDLTKISEGETIHVTGLSIFNPEDSDQGVSGTWCLPLSNEKIAFLSFIGTNNNEEESNTSEDDRPQLEIRASLLDLNQKTQATKKFFSEGKEIQFFNIEDFEGTSPIQFGNYYILNKSIIDLENFEMTSHGFEFGGHVMTVCGSSLYLSGDITGKDSIGSYFINSQGKLEKKWGTGQLQSDGDKQNLFINEIKASDQFIALRCSVSDMAMAVNPNSAFQCIHLLNLEGEFVSEMRFPLKDEVIVHLVNDILIYKTKKENCLNFWHIPSQTLINKFPWNGSSKIYSIKSTNEEVIFLTRKKDNSIKLVAFQMNELTSLKKTQP